MTSTLKKTKVMGTAKGTNTITPKHLDGKRTLKRRRNNNNNNNNNNSSNSMISVVKRKGDTDGKFIPKYKIEGHKGNATVYITLNTGQSVILNRNTLSFMDAYVDVNTRAQGGILSGLKRMLFTSSSMFMTQFKASRDKQRVGVASFMLGTIIPLKIQPGETYLVADKSLLCFTDNLDLKTRAKFQNIFVSQSLFQVHITNNSKSAGMVWVASFGGHSKLKLEPGRSIKIAHGLFLACNADTDFSVATLKGVKSFFFGTTSTMMQFYGPVEVYVHNRNYDYLIADIIGHVGEQNSQRDVKDDFVTGGVNRIVDRGIFGRR